MYSNIANLQEYKKILGLDQEDIGSRALLLRYVVKKAKKKGYHTNNFYHMPKKQLYAIHKKLS